MATRVVDTGGSMSTDVTCKCWGAEMEIQLPPSNRIQPDFDDSYWPNAGTWGRNDADDSHLGLFIRQPIGYPDTEHVKPGITGDAEWVWCECTIILQHD